MSIAGKKRPRRMKAEERKQAILQAAAPIMARGGFSGTSVRDIAVAAGVSEALLYKHFPSKQALYEQAAMAARESSRFTISRFATLKPSSESFVLLTYATITFIVFGFPGRKVRERSTERLVFRSLLEDGEYARAVFADTAAAWMDYVVQSYDAAVAAGDIEKIDVQPAHRFRFVQQLAMALRLSHLPKQPAFEYAGSKRDLTDQAVLFSLRGLGLTSGAIARYFQPQRLRAILEGLFKEVDT
jgi:AcrR family transcriptional regulator